MSDVVVSIDIDAPRQQVWDDVARLDTHVEWMADADRIDFLTPYTSGPGVAMEVATSFGPFRTKDRMEVVAWVPPERIEVVHVGLFTGRGAFELASLSATRTRFTWQETIRFPWYFGGRIGASVARPVFRWVWRRNLRRLAARFSDR